MENKVFLYEIGEMWCIETVGNFRKIVEIFGDGHFLDRLLPWDILKFWTF